MHRKKAITTSLAIIAIVTAVSLITASSSGIVTLAFASKRGSDSTGSSSTKKGTSTTDSSSTSSGSKSKFIKCVTAISGSSPSKTEVDNCWDKAFGSGGSGSGSDSSSLTLGPNTSSGGGSSSSSGRGDTSTEG